MRKTNKVLATLAIASMTLSMLPFNAFAVETVPTHLAGKTASQTAVAIAEQTGWTGTAILASSASYGMVDALTSGPLATFLKAPILLQEPGDVLNADTKAELIKLSVTKVYVTSGSAVISPAVLNQLIAMHITVIALGGSDRFETSVNIANKMVELGAPVTKVAVAYGWLNQDALSIASIASAKNEPILLTEKNSISTSVKTFLTANTSVVATDVIGGTGVISDATKAKFPTPTRYSGNTAYDTNVAVLKAFDSVLNYDNVFIANGETAIDALAGAPLAAKYKAGIVLIKGATNEGTTYASSKLSSSSVVTALGGTAVVPESILVDINTARDAEIAAATKAAAIAKIDGISLNGDATSITIQGLKDTGVTAADVIDKNLTAYQTAIAVTADLALDTTAKIQQMVTHVNTVQAVPDYLMFSGVTTEVASDDTPITDGSLAVTADGNSLEMTGSVDKSTAWFGGGAWNNYWVTLGIKIPDTITPHLNASGCYDNINVFTLKDRGNGNVWENSGTYEPVIAIDGTKYMQSSFALDSGSTVLDANGKMQLKVVFGGDYTYSGGATTQIPEDSFTIAGAQSLSVDYSSVTKAPTKAEIAISKIDGITQGGVATGVTTQDLKDAGVTVADVHDAKLAAYQAAISTAVDLALNTTDKIQLLVTTANLN